MKKINNKKINLSLRILTILAFSLIFIPFQVSAEGGVNYNYGTFQSPYQGGNTYTPNNTVYIPTPVYIKTPGPTKTVYVNNTKTTDTKTVAKAETDTSETTSATNADNEKNDYSSLTANAIYGTNSFLPSGLVQWVLFAIIILLLVILARRMFGYREAYEMAPLKHE